MDDPLKRLLGVFVHPEERRLRALFRLGLHLLALLVWGLLLAAVGFGGALAAGYVFGETDLRALARGAADGPFAMLAVMALNFVVIVPPTFFVARFVDRRSLAELGIPVRPRALLGLASGALVGAALIAAIASIEWLTGLAQYSVTRIDPVALTISVLIFAMVAVHEELLFRGYQLTNLAEGLNLGEVLDETTRVRGLVLAMLLTSLGFGAAHLMNPNPSVLGITNIALAGVFLALPFVLRGELGLSIGLHFGWNLAQSWLGMAVSGNEIPGALLVRELDPGHELVTGGAFGAEGGLLGLGALVVGIAVVVPLSIFTRDPARAHALGRAPERAGPNEPAIEPTAAQQAPTETEGG